MQKSATLFGLFLVSLAIFMLEVLMSRLTSVALFYHLAFYVIANGLLGGAAGGIVVFLWPTFFSRRRSSYRMYQFSVLMAIVVPISLALAYLSANFGTFFQPLAVYAMIQSWGVLLFVPFALGGVVVTLGITRSALATGRAYGANLLGAAAGCLIAVLLLETIDGTSAVLVAAALTGLAALCFVAAAPEGSTGSMLISVGLVLFFLAAAGINTSFSRPPFRPWFKMGKWSGPYSYVGWNSASRVTVSETQKTPPHDFAPYGSNTPDTVLTSRPMRVVQIDGTALTPMVKHGDRLRKHPYLDWSLRVFVHRLRSSGDVAILGVGGGMEVVAAARAGHDGIVGIDINDLILRLHTDVMPEFSGLANLPGVQFRHRDARRYLTVTNRTFDVISMSFVDTWASLGAGAGTFALSENGLYTVEAWVTYLNRLRPQGILTATRWFNPRGAGETTRLLALAKRALWEIGIETPRDHLALLQSGSAATLLVSRSPFTSTDLRRLHEEAEEIGFNVLVAPSLQPDKDDLRMVLSASSASALREAARKHALDLEPPSDDRPYFFNMLTFSSLFKGTYLPESPRHSLNINLIAIYSLLFALGASLLLTVVVLMAPTMSRWNAVKRLSWSESIPIFGYFAAIGLGFMFVEIGLMARLTIYLGYPTLALAVVLGGMISLAGLGSLLSERFSVDSGLFLLSYPIVIGAVIFLLAGNLEGVFHATRELGTLARVGVSLLSIGLVALPMGFALPAGLRFVRRYSQRRDFGHDLTPWLWCVNGTTSVLGSGLGLALALHFGISTTLAVAAVLYWLLVFFLPVLRTVAFS